MEITKASIDKFLAEMMRKEKNALNLIQLYGEIFATKEDKITIEYLTENGEMQTFDIPSVAYLTSAIKRLESNFKNLAEIGILQASILLPDGTRRIIIAQNLPQEPNIVCLDENYISSTFRSKDIDVVSKFITPLTYIPFDIKNFVDEKCKIALINKITLELRTQEEKNIFENNINGKIYEYSEIKDILQNNRIKFSENISEVHISPRLAKNSGKFNVLTISKEPITKINEITGIKTTKNRIFYQLDKTTYKNNLNNSDVNLKIGDELIVCRNNSGKNTIYTIDTIDYSTNRVSLLRIEGLDPIQIGVDELMINPSWEEKVIVEIPILKNEIFIPFIRPLQESHSIINTQWGSSHFIIANNLRYFDNPDKTFLDYFNMNVTDFRSGLQKLKEIDELPVSKAVIPNTPILDVKDFNVKMINGHKITSIESITKEKYAEKEKIKSSISTLDESIKNLKDKLSNETNTREKDKIQKEIDNNYKTRKQLVNTFASLVSDITNVIKDANNFSPKYRVRGFFNIPAGKYYDTINQTGYQEIIKFECEYRYLRKDNTEESTSVMTYKDNNGNEIKASYSNWNQLLTLRQRIKTFNPMSGKVEWEKEDLLNPEIINVNQIDIPISEDEAVEIRVRSISEVGYPTTITYSNWSKSIIIQFPKELTNINNSITKEIINDQFITAIETELTNIGLYNHLADSFISGDKNYVHSAKNIATDYYTQENKQMSVAQIIEEIKRSVENIENQYGISVTPLEVYITDDKGNRLVDVNNNDNITLFAGYYKNLVKGENYKGEIITKLYYLCIKNNRASNIELLSFVPGMYENRLPHGDNYTDYTNNKYEYDSYRKYFDVPISYKGITQNEDYINHHLNVEKPFIELPIFSSSQVKGQYVYSRYNDITLSNPLYENPTDENNGYNTLLLNGGSNSEEFIFAGFEGIGNNATIKNNGKLTDFCCHINHPDVQSKLLANNTIYDQTTFMPLYTYSGKVVPNIIFGHSKLASLESGETNYYKQLAYKDYAKVTSNAKMNNFPRKIGFSTNDRYLIGKNTCGAYLYLAPDLPKSLYTGSNIYNKGLSLNNSEIRIPIVFSCRMTDYFGVGDTGIGRIGGDANKSNLYYSKKIGLDFLPKNQDIFSFDLTVEMQYQQNV